MASMKAESPTRKSKADAMRYDVHPSLRMVQKWIQSLKETTGRSLEEWRRLISASGPATDDACRKWLKESYGLGTNVAAHLVDLVRGRGRFDGDPEGYLRSATQYIEDMFTGGKADLRPIYDALVRRIRGLFPDVKICPCQTMVPIFREHAIAHIRPSTRTRIDLGLALGAYEGKLPARLIDTGGQAKKDRITHRIELHSVDEIDATVERWLCMAYELDAPKVAAGKKASGSRSGKKA